MESYFGLGLQIIEQEIDLSTKTMKTPRENKDAGNSVEE